MQALPAENKIKVKTQRFLHPAPFYAVVYRLSTHCIDCITTCIHVSTCNHNHSFKNNNNWVKIVAFEVTDSVH